LPPFKETVMAEKTIARLYDHYDDAVRTVGALEAAGISHEDITILANKLSADRTDGESEAGAGAGMGATLGAVAGGGAGLLAGLGLLAIPGVGPVVAAGWLVATLVGAGAGGAAGGILGGLVGAGFSKEHAAIVAESVRRGGSLVTVRCPPERRERVEAIMDAANPVDLQAREAVLMGFGWATFEENGAPYSREDIARERERARPQA
jgi:hypothetical protein